MPLLILILIVISTYERCVVFRINPSRFYHTRLRLYLLTKLSPELAWHCPMVLWYIFFFTPLLVYSIMLTDVLPTGGVTTSVECLSHSILFCKLFIISIKSLVRNPCTLRNYYLLAYVTPASSWCFNTIIFHHELDFDLICENQPKILRLVLLCIDL